MIIIETTCNSSWAMLQKLISKCLSAFCQEYILHDNPFAAIRCNFTRNKNTLNVSEIMIDSSKKIGF